MSIKTLRLISSICESKKFLWFIIALFIIQATWVALSFRYPMLFDENYHFGVIRYFAHHLSPIPLHQSAEYDQYGNLAYSNASLYHYMMSYPYRFIHIFTNNLKTMIILLRLLNIAMVAFSIWLFAKLFKELGIKNKFSHLALLFFSTLPILIFLSATISYDNLLLPLTAYFFLIAVRMVQPERTIITKNSLKLIVVGLFASLVKFSFLPVFIFTILFLLLKSINKESYLRFELSLKNMDLRALTLLILAVILSLLFTFRYVYPIIRYRSPIPDCSLVLNQKRCMNSGVYYAVEQARHTKNTREAKYLQNYAGWWIGNMTSQFDVSAANTGTKIEFGKNVPIYNFLILSSIFLGLSTLVYQWSSIRKTEGWNLLVGSAMVLLISTFIFNAISYYSANTDLNTQTRYVLSVTPILMAMSIVAINKAIKNKSGLKLLIIVSILILCTQGAGDIKHIVSGSNSWYWQDNKALININQRARDFISPLVKE